MIRGMHAMFYSSEADALRAFIEDKLALPATDVGDGWLIFDAPEADLGVHPTENNGPLSGTADISFYCDEIEQTVADLTERGVEFTQAIEDHGYVSSPASKFRAGSRFSCTSRGTKSNLVHIEQAEESAKAAVGVMRPPRCDL